MRLFVVAVVLLSAAWAVAGETGLQADFRHEKDHVRENCGSFSIRSVGSCAYTLFTDHPLHIAVGNIAPQNGFGFGAALVAHHTPSETWRITWNADAVGATSGSWRAGGYMKLVHIPEAQFTTAPVPATGNAGKNIPFVHPYTVFNLYAQSISLQKLFFFGEGPNSLRAARSLFGMGETVVGGSVIKPVYEWSAINVLNLSLSGEINGRFVDIRSKRGETSPSIEQLNTEATAPGLAAQPGFIQFGEGVRIKPSLVADHLHLNYFFQFQQFVAPSASKYSFRRWSLTLDHEVPIYRTTTPVTSRDTNGPDDCAISVDGGKCPGSSRNRYGTVGFRFAISESFAGTGSTVPFYFQPTLGGSDINSNPTLSSFDDYRFRGPSLILLRESFEHSIWGPFGFTFMADQGKVALRRDDVDFNGLRHSFATGITLRGGGFPAVFLMFAFGGGESHHTIANVSTTLLGGSSRPSLF